VEPRQASSRPRRRPASFPRVTTVARSRTRPPRGRERSPSLCPSGSAAAALILPWRSHVRGFPHRRVALGRRFRRFTATRTSRTCRISCRRSSSSRLGGARIAMVPHPGSYGRAVWSGSFSASPAATPFGLGTRTCRLPSGTAALALEPRLADRAAAAARSTRCGCSRSSGRSGRSFVRHRLSRSGIPGGHVLVSKHPEIRRLDTSTPVVYHCETHVPQVLTCSSRGSGRRPPGSHLARGRARSNYVVKPTDTLWSIAAAKLRRRRPRGASGSSSIGTTSPRRLSRPGPAARSPSASP